MLFSFTGRNDNSISPNKLLLILMVLCGALVGAVVGAQPGFHGVPGSGVGIIGGAVVGFIFAKFINLMS